MAACSSDPDPTKPHDKPALDVQAATCLLVTDALGASVTALPVVGCDVPHTHEIFAKVKDTADDVFPGMSALETLAEQECYGRFEDYVGVNPFDSSLFITWIVPSLDSWNRENDREILCVTGPREARQLDRSVKDSQL